MMKALQRIGLALLVAVPLQAQEATPESFEKLISEIIPKDESLAWKRIPWHPTLGAAALEARKRDMPILLWAMNGHPLDCT
jgi:hypothetical protein